MCVSNEQDNLNLSGSPWLGICDGSKIFHSRVCPSVSRLWTGCLLAFSSKLHENERIVHVPFRFATAFNEKPVVDTAFPVWKGIP